MALAEKTIVRKRKAGNGTAKKTATAKHPKEEPYTDIRDVFGILSKNAVSGVFPPDASVTKLRYQISESE